MPDCEITCITKPHPQSPHEQITHVGNPMVPWKWPRENVIATIDAGTNTFYVLDMRTGRRADVRVVRAAGRPAYLQTFADGDWNNTLLALAQFPN